ncbi:PREDICTED: uncharacterized protein LOC108380976 [Rhagoletis zephyria]|uniref:uncharacterized protein LOC108380976 n=1 Tax=Rhagoletis zephyria TaxID=28612 RepID=UPI000811951E|nr:PREDICTED: uncharacterized protein LOC108380976 [Rhagoletis zephyria]
MIRTYLSEEDQRTWDQHVSPAAYALRSAVHKAIGLEPYKAIFGQTMFQHESIYELLRKLDALKEGDLEVVSRNERMELIREKLICGLEGACKNGQRSYNTRARAVSFLVGQLVYRKNFKLSNAAEGFNAKLAPKYLRSVVRGVKGNSLYELEDSSGRPVGVYHTKDLRV